MTNLFKKLILRFIAHDKLSKHCWITYYVIDPSLWLKNRDLGDAARRLLNDMPPDDQVQALDSVKKFYMESAVRQQNCPLLISVLPDRTIEQKV